MNKIKISICNLLFIICATNAFAQTYVPFNYSPKFIGSEIVTGSLAVGQTTGAETSAIGEFESTSKGFLAPRMTQAQRDAIASPATGLLIYQTDGTAGFYYYTGVAWASIGLSTPVSVANGGTGISSYAIGDIIYASGATTLSKLPIGTASQQLRVNAGATALEYFTPAASGITVGTTTISSGTSSRIPYNLAGVYQEQANFTIGSVAAGYLDVPSGYAQGGSFVMRQSANSLWLGSATGRTTVAQTNSTIIGVGAHPQNGGTGYNTCVGYNSNAAATGGGWGNSLLGTTSMASGTTASLNIGIGLSCLSGITTGNFNIGIGAQTFNGSNVSNSLAFGNGSTPTANNEIVFGSTAYSGSDYQSRYTDMYVGSGKTSANPADFTINATGGLGTNIAGANITIAGGKGTGTAAGGNNVEQTSVKLASGTTLQPLTDRHNIVGKYVDITAGSAQTFGNLALATSSTVSGGTVIYTIEANDATDYQSLSGVLKYDVVNKAGTLTVAFEDDQNSACACSAGTLTATVTATASGTNVLFQANAVSSLTETTLRVNFQVLNNFGVSIITPN